MVKIVSPRTWSGVITIAVGDSVAALVGHRWGHYFFHWPGTHRTIIGSAASFLSQVCSIALSDLGTFVPFEPIFTFVADASLGSSGCFLRMVLANRVTSSGDGGVGRGLH